jgi:hypothetical protein
MSESVKRRMSRHKQIVIAAIAVSAMLMYAIPAQQAAIAQDFSPPQDFAQSIIDETNQDIAQDQDIDQDQDQDQDASNDADQSNEATVSQDETNEQSNVLVTGDNEATTTQSGSNEATGEAAAASEGGSGGDIKKVKKSKWVDSSGGSSEAEAEVGIEQEVDNEAVTVQDSSATGNTLSNENTFGNDVAVVDQDNTADQTAVNLGFQDQDATQDQDADQTDTDFNFQYGFQCRADTSLNIPVLAEIC